MIVIILALSAAFMEAIGFVVESFLLNRKNPHHVSAAQRLVPSAYVNTLILGISLLIFPQNFWFTGGIMMILLLVSIGVIDMWYNILFLKALEISPASEVRSILSISPIITLVISTFLPGSHNSFLIFLVIFLIVGGIYLFNFHAENGFNWKNLLSPFKKKAVKYSLYSATLVGISYLLISYTLNQGYTSTMSLLFVRMLIIAVYSHIIFKPVFFPKDYKKSVWIFSLFSLEIIFVISRILQTYAISLGNVALITALAGTMPLFIAAYEIIFLKQKLHRNKIAGILLVIVGVVVVSGYKL